MPSLFDNRSAIDPRRSRGVASRAEAPRPTQRLTQSGAIAPVQPAQPKQPRQPASSAIVPAEPEAWDGEPDIQRDTSPPATPPNNTHELVGRIEDEDSSEEDYDDKAEDERKGLQIVKQRSVAAKYAAQTYAAKIPRDRVGWKHTPESCRMCCICSMSLGCCFGLVVLYGFYSWLDSDECSSETHTCDPNADCTNLDGAYDCNCQSGFIGTGWACVDVDECFDPARLGCDENAHCWNAAGSFACVCDDGYQGSGIACQDIDECLEDNGGCGDPLYHLCVNQPSDHLCTDRPECLEDNGGCGNSSLALCTERIGASPTCSDIDECATDNGGCGDGFICLNYDGLQGIGRACEDRDECVGSVSVAWTVSVAPELATDALKATASNAVADPSSVEVDPSATRVDIGDRWALGVPTGPLQSYSWVRQPGVCPTACGNAAQELVDAYKCRKDGLQVPKRFCLTNLGDEPMSTLQCPPTDDCDCIGSWSSCPSSCGNKLYTVTRARSGSVGNGVTCDAAHGDTVPCVSGEGSCFPYQNVSYDIDCWGHYPRCAADCGSALYNITRPQSGIGRICSFPGTSRDCYPGNGMCPPNVDCIGEWTACDSTCTRSFIVHISQLGSGEECEASHGYAEVCPAQLYTCTGTAADATVYPDCEQAYTDAQAGAAGAQDCPVGCVQEGYPVVCNDMEETTMDDRCVVAADDPSGTICKGAVTLAGVLQYDINIDPATMSTVERGSVERIFKIGMARVLTASGMEGINADKVNVVSITASGTHDCHEGYSTCTNFIGSYSCACKAGFEGAGQVCRDIDECSVNRGGCDASHARLYSEGVIERCVNMVGDAVTECVRVFGFTGTCPRECAYEQTSFDHVLSVFNDSIIGFCENTPGSYHCDCVNGFVLNTTDSATCHDVDECAEDNGGCGPAAYFNCTNNVGIEPVCGAGYPACDTLAGSYSDCGGTCFAAQLGAAKELLLGTPVATAWLGDGWCDNGAQGVDFNCSEWLYDNGDCGPA